MYLCAEDDENKINNMMNASYKELEEYINSLITNNDYYPAKWIYHIAKKCSDFYMNKEENKELMEKIELYIFEIEFTNNKPSYVEYLQKHGEGPL